MRRLLTTTALVVGALYFGHLPTAHADVVIDDPLHGFCWGNSVCTPNGGTNTAIQTGVGQATDFGFNVSPGPQIGDLTLVVLVPTNEIVGLPSGMHYSFNLTHAGINDTASFASSGTTFEGIWSSGFLDTFLGFNAQPNTPIGNFIGSKDQFDTTASAFAVFAVDLGQNRLTDQALGSNGSPEIALDRGLSSDLLAGSYFTAFLSTTNNGIIATVNSGDLVVAPFADPVPEPASIALLGIGLLGTVALRRRQRRN